MRRLKDFEKRLSSLEREVAYLRSEMSALKGEKITVPKGWSEKITEAVIAEQGPRARFFVDVTELMERERNESEAEGVTFLSGLFEDEETGQRAWWAAKAPIEKLLAEEKNETVAEMLDPLGSLHRLDILRALCYGPKTYKALSEHLGIQGGQLKHHIDILMDRGYVNRKERGLYSISSAGWKTFITVVHLAASVSDETLLRS